ncbi:PKD-like family lipoprotein [Pedobacter frigiditerrae]|uniref:PKD-like family lipoprotein n=1 Tax=Pedobacter frigiditerrae TaxID=2530452 RepID=UPI00292D8933|nr:PKD-like family lipoprotein [Pedobacter frigiditerrae]
MKQIFIFIIAILMFGACKKDLGNYDYHPPSEPTIYNLKDTIINAVVGDTLTINPKVTFPDADPIKDLSFNWEIEIAEELRSITLSGYPLKMLYNLGTGERRAKLHVTDKRNGLKYTIPFKIKGTTQFTAGTIVLTVDNGVTKLAFIRPDKSVINNLYEGLNGKVLPTNPVQLYHAKPLPYQPNNKEEIWVLCNDPAKESTILDGATLLYRNPFSTQFFKAPQTINIGRIEGIEEMGIVAHGTVNDKLYRGTLSTAPFVPDYGKFANSADGDYLLSPYYAMIIGKNNQGQTSSFYFGFNTKDNSFVSFDAGGVYRGSDYIVDNSISQPNSFNPRSAGQGQLIYMKPSSGTSYAFIKDESGIVQELSFRIAMENYATRTLSPIYKRVFKGNSLVNADTKWQRSAVNVFYFSANDKIYKYNPVNEDLILLEGTYSGKKVTMLKLSADGTRLTAGYEGAILTLDVSVGKNGNILQTQTGIQGAVIDQVIKN